MDYIELGPVPANEPCAQLGDTTQATQEESRYIRLLKRLNPKVPDGCRYARKAFYHEFGTYHEVVLYYDRSIPEHVAYVLQVENNLPARFPECLHVPIDLLTGKVSLSGRCEECGKDLNSYA